MFILNGRGKVSLVIDCSFRFMSISTTHISGLLFVAPCECKRRYDYNMQVLKILDDYYRYKGIGVMRD